jgi:hypothetical protein
MLAPARTDHDPDTPEGGFVMVREASKRKHGGSPGRSIENRLSDDWPVYVALLPAVLASAAIGITAAIALGTASSWHQRPADGAGVKAALATDDYVEGLARLGIANLPGYEPSAVVHHSGPGGGPLPLTHLARGCVLLG